MADSCIFCCEANKCRWLTAAHVAATAGGRAAHTDGSNATIAIPQTELFDVFQRNRCKIFAWLEQHPDERNSIMESMIRVLTLDGWFESDEDTAASVRHWHSLQEEGYVGRYQPDTERRKLADDELAFPTCKSTTELSSQSNR